MYFFIEVRVFLGVSACTSLYMCMYFFVYVHVTFDVSMQAFGLVLQCLRCASASVS